MKRLFCGLMVALLLTNMLMVMFNVQPVKSEWTGTVYIMADGSIDPPDAPITTYDNTTYTLTDNIRSECGIVIERNNVIIDGSAHILLGEAGGTGIDLNGRYNVTIKNFEIKGFGFGISLVKSKNITLLENSIINNTIGAGLEECSDCEILENYVSENGDVGIYLSFSHNISIYRNEILRNNLNGIQLENNSSYNNIVENKILENGDNGIQMMDSSHNAIFQNNITLNHNSGIEMGYSSSNNISHNNIQNSEMGIALGYSNNNVIEMNSFENHFGASAYAIWLEESDDNTITENKLTDAYHFIGLYTSFSNLIKQNNVSNVFDGAVLVNSCDNVFGKNIMQSLSAMGIGIDIGYESFSNIFYQNTITGFYVGVCISFSNNSVFYWNNFIGNEIQVEVENSTATWDNGYPDGGNYWSDYIGIDVYSGPYQNETGSDGIGDTPYIVDENNTDHYPLMGIFGGLTMEGQNITSYPSSDVCLIFENVTADGVTTVNMTGTAPKLPSGFKLAGYYYDIKTTANYTGTIKIRINYNDSNLTSEEEASLRFMQWGETLQQWMDITTLLDTQSNVIYGETSHLSIFALVTPLYAPTTYTLTITATVGGTTNPTPGTYTYTAGSIVQVTAISASGHIFDHWELNGTNIGSANPYTIIMENNYNLKALFVLAPALTVSISPTSASILVGQLVTFTSTVSGGASPYSYQWYLNDNPVLGATSPTWTFTPTTSGIFYVYLKVTDFKGNTAQSDVAHIIVTTVPVGGYSIPINIETETAPIILYIMMFAILTIAFTSIKRKKPIYRK